MHHDMQMKVPTCPQGRPAGLEERTLLPAVFCPRCRISYPVYDGILFKEASLSAGNSRTGNGGKAHKNPAPDRIAL